MTGSGVGSVAVTLRFETPLVILKRILHSKISAEHSSLTSKGAEGGWGRQKEF